MWPGPIWARAHCVDGWVRLATLIPSRLTVTVRQGTTTRRPNTRCLCDAAYIRRLYAQCALCSYVPCHICDCVACVIVSRIQLSPCIYLARTAAYLHHGGYDLGEIDTRRYVYVRRITCSHYSILNIAHDHRLTRHGAWSGSSTSMWL